MVLGLSSKEMVARVCRLRIADDTPLAIERAALSSAVLPDPEAVGASLYAALEQDRQPAGARHAAHFGRQSRRGRRAAARGCRRASPASTSSASPISQTGKVIEFTRSVYRGDTYDFVAELRLSGPAEQGAR